MMAAINTASGNPSVAAPTAVKSPRHAGDGVGSPRSRRPAGRAAGASPWTQIVRGESEPIAAVLSSPLAAAPAAEPTVPAGASAASSSSSPPSSSSSSPPPPLPSVASSPSLVEDAVGESSESGNAGKRQAWNKPSNGGSEVGPVMGADSWPALGESARGSTKSSSESLKGLSDGLSSISLSQVSGATIPTINSPKKQAHPTPTPNQTAPLRQRSMKRNNSNASSNGGLPQQQAPAGLVNETASSNPSPKDHTQRSGVGSHSHGGGDHPQQRNTFRNRNGGPHQRGDGPHHQNYGGRRDQDRGNHDWNSHNRSFNGRDPHIQQQRVMPRVFRGQTPPHSPGTFIPNRGMGPYGPHPMPYPGELAPQLVYITPPPPFMAPIPPAYVPIPDRQLPSKIVNQIDYYFSNENLIRDTFLRKNMDDQGWVPIKLIAGFNKVKHLTDNIQYILEAVRTSNVVEVQGDKVRRRSDWGRWIMPPAARVQNFGLEERNMNFSIGGQSNYQPQFPNGDAAGQFTVQAGADRTFSGRN